MTGHATIDFETYCEAGFIWSEADHKWLVPKGAQKRGIGAVGTAAYAEHPTLEVLCLYYKLPDETGATGWVPGMPPPEPLLTHIANGGLVEAHKVMFERLVWHHYCHKRLGWPDLPPLQLRCSMAKANVNNFPAALGPLTDVLDTRIKKDKDGTRLINKFSIPQKPTKKRPTTRIFPSDDPEDAVRFYQYCGIDVLSEEEASGRMEPMSDAELRFWQLDQAMNWKGIAIDRPAVQNMIAILEQAQEKYGQEFRQITNGLKPTQVQAFRGWLAAQGVMTDSLDAAAIEDLLKRVLPPHVKRAIEIRELVSSASVKKLYAMERSVSSDNRVRDIIIHHGARTGRPKGELLQPLNMPKAGSDLIYCDRCNEPSKPFQLVCPFCAGPLDPLARVWKWPSHPEGTINPVDSLQKVMSTRNLDSVEKVYGSALKAITGCMRGMIVAGEGMEFIASDYSAIEAVVTAALSGCQWRLDVFRNKEDIYLVSASRITGRTLEEYKQYKQETGVNHPDRNNIGKISELGLGFSGWIPAWRQFDSSDNFSDDQVKQNILTWRDASPEIPEMWGGQTRGKPWMPHYRLERYGFEGAFVNAVQYPGTIETYAGITFQYHEDKDRLDVTLLSGRPIYYQQPRLWPKEDEFGVFKITYMTWNTNPKYGAIGWAPMNTYGGRICENIVQATAHDIQRFGIENLWVAGYETVLHVYDENVTEVPIGFGSIEEMERIMGMMPPWAHGWPIRASGGWRGKRFRKD